MGGLSIWHWVIVLVVVLLVFGTKKLRNIGSDLGGAVKGFKDGLNEGNSDAAKSGTDAQSQVAGKVADSEKQTIDVDAKEKS